MTEVMESPVIESVPLPLTAVEDVDNGAPYERLGGMLDADGELLDPEARSDGRSDMAIPHSLDNDKSNSEPVILPGR